MAEAQTQRLVNEEGLVQAVGETIGYGRTMQLCEALWGKVLEADGLPAGGAIASYCCVVFLIPCPGQAHKRQAGSHCDWCCGAGRVTKKVAEAMSKLEPPT